MARPSKFKSIDQEQMKKLYLNGFTDHQVADFFNIADSTIYLWMVDNPKFSESIKEWKTAADSMVERSLYHRAIGYTHQEEKIFCNAKGKIVRAETLKHYPPSEMACMYWLNNRKRGEWNQRPTEDAGDELKDTELTFNAVPVKKDTLPERYARFLN